MVMAFVLSRLTPHIGFALCRSILLSPCFMPESLIWRSDMNLATSSLATMAIVLLANLSPTLSYASEAYDVARAHEFEIVALAGHPSQSGGYNINVGGVSLEVVQVSIGEVHTCAVTTEGAAFCWGLNAFGELGDGTDKIRHEPVPVSGLDKGVASISIGGDATCALTFSGGVMCWGRNAFGSLGDGTIMKRTTPGMVHGLDSGVTSVTVGDHHACAIMTSGTVQCWGSNGFKELGDGTTDDRLKPVQVLGLESPIASVAVGGNHTCALTVSGAVKCWGANFSGALGRTTQDYSDDRPASVIGLEHGVVLIAAGSSHSCALTTEGGVKCWGSNDSGQLGDGTTVDRAIPVHAFGLQSGVTSLRTDSFRSCAVLAGTAITCWGLNLTDILHSGEAEHNLIPVSSKARPASVQP